MTTNEAIQELTENISNYPEVKSVEIIHTNKIFLNFWDDRKKQAFNNGNEMLYWLEKNLKK